MPASLSAASTASRHSWVTDLSSNFPQGCMPTPRTATSLMCVLSVFCAPLLHRAELPTGDLVSVLVAAQPVDNQLDLHSDLDLLEIVDRDAAEHAQPLRQVHHANGERLERLVVLHRRPRGRVLGGANP